MAYYPMPEEDDYVLLATHTYEHYLDVENPFSMVEILPNIQSQPNLPLSYRVEEGGHDILYQFTYEFDETGRPTKRVATSAAGSEEAIYQYYQ